MTSKPALSQYLGIAFFLTVLSVFATYGRARGTNISVEFLAFVLAFSAIHISVTYFMIRQWIEYATGETTTAQSPATAVDN
jgi:hypothetical protein